MNIVAAILIFGLIVLIHEYGHFLLARKFGVTVLEFAIGMGPKIHTWHGKNTDYSLRALPIGGFCSMLGENDEDEKLEGSFISKPVWQRFLIIFAGPFFNFILAFIMALILISNAGIDRCNVSSTLSGYPAEEAGIQAGDVITRVDNRKITVFRDLTLYMMMHPGKTMQVTVKRDTSGKTEFRTFDITPKFNEETQTYVLGIERNQENDRSANIGETVYYSFYEVKFNITSTIDGLSMLVSGKASVNDLSGPVRIVSIIGDTVKEAEPYGAGIVLLNLANLILLLSATLGIMNLLPLPALDGGRLVFLIIEGIMGRPVNRKVEAYIHFVGFVLLMMLMVFVMFNDVRNLVK